jgi:hypothetical protein
MKRNALLIARLIAVPALAIGLFEFDRWIGSALHPSLDAYDRGSYVPVVLGVLGSTVASAVVAGIAGSAAALLYGRWALLPRSQSCCQFCTTLGLGIPYTTMSAGLVGLG